MKKLIPLFLFLIILFVSCGTMFNADKRKMAELGGTYNKDVGEEISMIYKNGGIEEVINTVYQIDYEGGDPYVVVEGYLGEEAYEEFKKTVKELKLEIEDLRKGVNLGKDQIGGNEGLALAVLDDIYPEGLVIEALGGIDKKNTQDFKALLDKKIAMRNQLRTILDELGIEGIKEALVKGEYTEDDIETYLGKSTLDEAKSMIKTFSLEQESSGSNSIEVKHQEYQYLMGNSVDDLTNLVGLSSPIYKSFEVDGETVFRWVEFSITDYDTEGNEIHFINSRGYEYWKEYDANGNEVYFIDSHGDEEWRDYDADGNEIYYKYADGSLEGWKLYDTKGNCVYHKYINIFKTLNGNSSTVEFETWFEYDSKGNEIHEKGSYGDESWTEYDNKGNEIHYIDSYGYESWSEYDENDNRIHFKYSDGYECWTEYDSTNNEIHYKDSDGYEYWREYDAEGNEVYFKSNDGEERWTEYEHYENGVISKMIEYSRF